mgnify:FL=1
MKKLISLLLVLAMLLSFAACKESTDEPDGSTTTKSTTTTAATTTAVVEENPFEDFMEITWLTQLNADWQEGRWDELELEEMFNVDIQMWPMDSLMLVLA